MFPLAPLWLSTGLGAEGGGCGEGVSPSPQGERSGEKLCACAIKSALDMGKGLGGGTAHYAENL